MIEGWNLFRRGWGSRRVTRATAFLGVCGLAAQLIGQYQVNMGGMNRASYQSPGTIRYTQAHNPQWSAARMMSTSSHQRGWAAQRVAGVPQYGRYGTRPRATYIGAPGHSYRSLYKQGAGTRTMGTYRYGSATGTRRLSRSSGYGGTRSSWAGASRGRSKGTIRY